MEKEDTKERLEKKQEKFGGDLEPVLEAETYAEDELTTKKTKTRWVNDSGKKPKGKKTSAVTWKAMELMRDQLSNVASIRLQKPKINKKSVELDEKALKKSIHIAVEYLSQNGYINFEAYLNVLFILKVNKYIGNFEEGQEELDSQSKQGQQRRQK